MKTGNLKAQIILVCLLVFTVFPCFISANTSPKAVIKAQGKTIVDSKITVEDGEIVQFYGSDSYDNDGDPLTYLWDFGDGTATSNEINPTHTYTEAGIYTLSLVVDDGVDEPSTGEWQCIVYGDTRSNDDAHRSVLTAIVNNTPDYKFIINVGDVIGRGGQVDMWETWKTACNEILGGTGQSSIPPKYMSCPGNHEDLDVDGMSNWKTYLPGQQRYGNNGQFFVLDYKNARFIILDSCPYIPRTGAQRDMLLDAIQNNSKTWLFAIWHHPIFSFGTRSYQDTIHDQWRVPLYQNGCDIIFVGHDHHYVRTKKIELNGTLNPPLDSVNGTVQIVTGNSGAGLYSVDENKDGNGYMLEYSSDEDQANFYGYTELTINDSVLVLRHYRASDNKIMDTAVYTANPK